MLIINKVLLGEFEQHKRFVGFGDYTIKKYISTITKFLLAVNKPFTNICPDDVYKWWKSSFSKLKPSSQNIYLAYVSSFFNYCLEEGYLEKSPVKQSWRNKVTNSAPKYIKRNEMAEVVVESENHSLKERAVIELLRSSGLRRSELSNLCLRDLDLRNNAAVVIGKGNKQRQVHFSEEACILLKLITEGRNPDDPVFLNRFKRKIQPESVYLITTKIGRRLEIKLNPHRFRYSFASSLASNGESIEFIAEELGHERLSTTQIYSRIPSNEMKKLYRSYMW